MSERWDRVTEIFVAARGFEGPEREEFLAAACKGDGMLLSEVESLLRNHKEDSFLARPASSTLIQVVREVVALPEPGQLLRFRYRLEARMATGGQALVYRATDQVLSRPVVIKFLRVEGRHELALQSRLREEGEVLTRIDHPGVVGILDTGELADGSPFLVIQYIEGESLREALSTGPFECRRAAAITRQIGSALSAAHALGIAHRDLKPENIMLQRLGDGTESVKLIDFGIAKMERSPIDPATTTVMIAGTIRYMAPEQWQGVNTPASDIYSLALIVCEMLSGHPHVRALPRGIARPVRRALEAALAFSPKERPVQTRVWCDEVAEALTFRTRRRFVIAVGSAAALVGGGVVASSRWYAASRDTPRIIEYTAPFDPLTEGFRVHNDVVGTIVSNVDRTDYDAWRVTSLRQGDYYQHLSGRQKRLALERGWKLSAVMRAEEGMAYVNVNFAGYGRRFGVAVFVQPGEDLVRLHTQSVPSQQGLDYRIARRDPIYRRYELVYDPGLASASLWIDGNKVLSGYAGQTQFQEDWGLIFGACIYKSDRGVGAFKSVRFEINPG